MRVIVSFVGGWGHAEPLLPVAMLAMTALDHNIPTGADVRFVAADDHGVPWAEFPGGNLVGGLADLTSATSAVRSAFGNRRTLLALHFDAEVGVGETDRTRGEACHGR